MCGTEVEEACCVVLARRRGCDTELGADSEKHELSILLKSAYARRGGRGGGSVYRRGA